MPTQRLKEGAIYINTADCLEPTGVLLMAL